MPARLDLRIKLGVEVFSFINLIFFFSPSDDRLNCGCGCTHPHRHSQTKTSLTNDGSQFNTEHGEGKVQNNKGTTL